MGLGVLNPPPKVLTLPAKMQVFHHSLFGRFVGDPDLLSTGKEAKVALVVALVATVPPRVREIL